MQRKRWIQGTVVAAAVAWTGMQSIARADDSQSVADLANQVADLKAQLAQVKATQEENWLTQERTDQIKAIVEDVLNDAKTRGQFADGPNFGYNNGFFVQTDNQMFRFQANGYLQFRYTYSHDEAHNQQAFSSGAQKAGDVSGFDFRRARLIFSGYAFNPNLTYMLSGDFAGDSSNNNDFQTLDIYMAYKFNDLFAIRAGSFLTPYSRLEYISSGLEGTDFPVIFNPFDPVRTLGVSVYGTPIKDKLTYEVNVNNGQKSNTAGRAAEIGGKNDNRLAFYSRVQFAGAGAIADFNDEPDLRKDTSSLAWMLGAAAGWESANSSSSAFPGTQANTSLPGFSTIDSPGFTSYTYNGDLYRGTVDFAAKYHGFAFNSALFLQQVNQNSGVSAPSSIRDTSLFEMGYFGQLGYMFAPKWEAYGRFGQLLTEGGPNRMEEYAGGLNYYLFGQNAKIQGEAVYVPNEAAFSSSTASTSANTQDLIFRLQLQLKF
ncbi:MAG TPA: porin [Phycisphaerae bacterium]|nr:porin [Phycisphaerae bacterium]